MHAKETYVLPSSMNIRREYLDMDRLFIPLLEVTFDQLCFLEKCK